MTNEQKIYAFLFGMIIYMLFTALISPFFTIWSLNTIFGFEIAYSFKNWIAIIWLTVLIHGIKFTSKTTE